MAYSNWTAQIDVTEKKFGENIDISRYNFYQLMELLCRFNQVEAAQILSLSAKNEPVRLISSAGLEYPIRDLVSLSQKNNGKYLLELSFLGLHGSQSPLPGYYLESLAKEYLHKENQLVDFMDLFNHRFALLAHQVWRKYRYYINYRNGGQDHFSERMFSLVGLGYKSTRNKLSVNHSKMLAYAGILSSPARSPEVICSLVAHCFDLNHVSLRDWQFRYVHIDEEEQNRLGVMRKEAGRPAKGRSCLGVNFTLGSKKPDRGSKFELRITQLSRREFLSFLPNGENYLPLVTFMSFILKDQFAWDLYLGLSEKQVSGMVLGTQQDSLLGWTTFTGKVEKEPNVLLTIRE
ncbi:MULTISPECIES: type VI secretion system baseplate subunit TssG [Avibacterium]|uniref:Type VI secretion system baseplate subunit TssG n=1 Tax=Avibacterium paragallinarum TaxID=728 RepID=A0ABU7QSD9_AVIPA|nr:type VI secretion system baseplate subunit TssG [Avibacterium paragallinarum]